MSVNLYDPTTGTMKNVAGDTVNPQSINNMIAPIETGVASKAYAVGEQFIMNNILYTTTSAIAQNDSIIVGTNCQVAEKLSEQIENINNNLTDVSIGSQIGNGTSNFTVSSSKRRLLCITKKNDVIIESKEIPMSVLNANDVIPLGNQAPIIGVAPKKNLSGITTQTSLVGKEIANYVSSGGYPALFYDSNDQTNYQNIQKSIGLATDLGNALGAKITYNGNDAFTINVADSSLSVYVY